MVQNLQAHIDAARQRPSQFLGSLNHNGVVNIIKFVMDDLPPADIPQLKATFEFFPENRVRAQFENIHLGRLSALLHPQADADAQHYNLALVSLAAYSKALKILVNYPQATGAFVGGEGKLEINTSDTVELPANSSLLEFTIDPAIFGQLEVSYAFVNIFLKQFAYLYPGIHITSVEKRGALQQRIFYYPQGVSEQLHETFAALGQSVVSMDLRTEIDENRYQVSIAYPVRVPKNLPPIRTYANSETTFEGGSLQTGVMKGFRMAIKEIAGRQPGKLKAGRKRIEPYIQAIAAIRGHNLSYDDAFKTSLDMKEVKKKIRHYVFMQTLAWYEAHPEELMALVDWLKTKQ